MPQNPLDPHAVFEKAQSIHLELKSWRGIRCVDDHMHTQMREKKNTGRFCRD